MGELKGQDRFCSTVYIGAARRDPVTAEPRCDIAERRAPVVGAEKPVPCRPGMFEPARVARRCKSGPGGLDGCLRLQRLLVERQRGGMLVVEALAPDRAEVPTGGDLAFGNPLQRLQPGRDIALV